MLASWNIAVASLLCAGSLAAPVLEKRSLTCLTRADAQQVATNYANLLAAYTTDLANAALSEDFTDYSEGVNSLMDSCPEPGLPSVMLMGPTFTNREQFEGGQGTQPAIDFTQLQMWYSCESVTVRWMTTNTVNSTLDGSEIKPVAGILVLGTNPAPAGNQYPFVINTCWSEFDAAAWVQNLQAAGMCPSSTTGTTAAPTVVPTPIATSIVPGVTPTSVA